MRAATTKAFGIALAFLIGALPARADVVAGLDRLRAGDVAGARAEFSRALEAGDADAAYYLGRLAEAASRGVPDPSAVTLYERGVEGGSARAMARLGLLHREGLVVLQDYARSGELVCAAAEAGIADGLYDCAIARLDGLGVARDRTAGLDLLDRAVAAGHVGAKVLRAQLLLEGPVAERDPRRAAELLQQAAASGNPVGVFALGQAFALGIGVDQDPVKAHAFLNIAAALGHPEGEAARDLVEAQLDAAGLLRAHRHARAWRPLPLDETGTIDRLLDASAR